LSSDIKFVPVELLLGGVGLARLLRTGDEEELLFKLLILLLMELGVVAVVGAGVGFTTGDGVGFSAAGDGVTPLLLPIDGLLSCLS